MDAISNTHTIYTYKHLFKRSVQSLCVLVICLRIKYELLVKLLKLPWKLLTAKQTKSYICIFILKVFAKLKRGCLGRPVTEIKSKFS